MGRFSGHLSYLLNHDKDAHESFENPDEATLFALIRAFDREKASHIHLYYHPVPEVREFELLLIAACYRSRFTLWYRNHRMESDWFKLEDPAQSKNYQVVPYRLDNGEMSEEYMRYTVTLERVLANAAYFLKHGTINHEEIWWKPRYKLVKNPKK